MELSERVIQVRVQLSMRRIILHSHRMILYFLFGDVGRPVGLVLNNSDPLECFVIFPPAAPKQDVIDLPEQPSWVGASMQLGLHKPKSGMLTIVSKLLQGKDLEEGKEYEYIPIHPLDPEVPDDHSPRKRRKDLLLLLWHMSSSTCQHRNYNSCCHLSNRKGELDRMTPWVLPMMCQQSYRLY